MEEKKNVFAKAAGKAEEMQSKITKKAKPNAAVMYDEEMKQLNCRIPSDLHCALKTYCAANGVTISDTITKLLQDKFL